MLATGCGSIFWRALRARGRFAPAVLRMDALEWLRKQAPAWAALQFPGRGIQCENALGDAIGDSAVGSKHERSYAALLEDTCEVGGKLSGGFAVERRCRMLGKDQARAERERTAEADTRARSGRKRGNGLHELGG